MMAYALKVRGVKNARIVILDTKDHFAMQTLFIDGWERHYAGMIEWTDPTIHGSLEAADAKALTGTADCEPPKATLVNVIPPRNAGRLARGAGSLTTAASARSKPPSWLRGLVRRSM